MPRSNLLVALVSQLSLPPNQLDLEGSVRRQPRFKAVVCLVRLLHPLLVECLVLLRPRPVALVGLERKRLPLLSEHPPRLPLLAALVGLEPLPLRHNKQLEECLGLHNLQEACLANPRLPSLPLSAHQQNQLVLSRLGFNIC